jgi:hypothetical protein
LASFIRTMRQANFRTARGHPPHDVLSVTLLLGTRQRFPAKSIASVLPLNCEIAAWNEKSRCCAAVELRISPCTLLQRWRRPEGPPGNKNPLGRPLRPPSILIYCRIIEIFRAPLFSFQQAIPARTSAILRPSSNVTPRAMARWRA